MNSITFTPRHQDLVIQRPFIVALLSGVVERAVEGSPIFVEVIQWYYVVFLVPFCKIIKIDIYIRYISSHHVILRTIMARSANPKNRTSDNSMSLVSKFLLDIIPINSLIIDNYPSASSAIS